MRTRPCLLLALTISLIAGSAAAQIDQTEQMRVRHLSENVIVVDTEAGYPSQMAVASDRGLVVFGALWGPEIAARWRARIEQEFGRRDIAYVVYSNARLLGVAGHAVYEDALTLAHESCRLEMRQREERLAEEIRREIRVFRRKAERSRGILAEPPADPAATQLQYNWMRFCDQIADDFEAGCTQAEPRVTFRERLSLDLGNLTLNLIDFGPARHGHNMLVEIPEEELLLLSPFSDLHLAPLPHWRGQELVVPGWLSILEELLEDGREYRNMLAHFGTEWTREDLVRQYNYIRELWDGVTAATEEGLTFAAAQERLSIDTGFAHVRDWPIWDESGEEWVRGDHEGHLVAYWRALHPSAADAVAETLDASGIESAWSRFRELMADPTNAYFVLEAEFNSLGYRLLGAERKPEAIAIFRMNVEAHPASGNTHDSLGEAYMADGQNEPAIESYRRALELDPENSNAVEMLRRLER